MNEVLKNCELFVNILRMSRTVQVQRWDREAFQRAFRWAAYFEQVYKKGHAKPGFADKLDLHLEKVLTGKDSCLGVSKLRFADLEKVTDILLNNLLQNPHLNVDFYLQLVAQFQQQRAGDEGEGFVDEVKALAKLKATLQVLQLVQRRFCSEDDLIPVRKQPVLSLPPSPTHSQQHIPRYVIKANAIILRRCLANSIGVGPTISESVRTQLYSKLAGVLGQGAGEEVLFTALTSSASSASGEAVQAARVTAFVLQFVEEVVCEGWSLNWLDFLQLPLRDLLCRTARDMPEFASMYARVLCACADGLQSEICAHERALLASRDGDSEASEHVCARSFASLKRHIDTACAMSRNMQAMLCKIAEERCADDDAGVWSALQPATTTPPPYQKEKPVS